MPDSNIDRGTIQRSSKKPMGYVIQVIDGEPEGDGMQAAG
jgi:hypothetical protein